MKNITLLLLLVALLIAPSLPVLATPSLDTKDMMEFYIKYKDAGKTVTQGFTVLKDAEGFTDYYYVPGNPSLVVNNGTPEFSLIKYQAKDPENPQKLIEGGILQFAVTLDIPADVQKKIKTAIVKTMKKRIATVNAEIKITEEQIQKKEANGETVSKLRKRFLEEKKKWVAQAATLSAGAVELKMIPIKDTEVNIYTPGGDEMVPAVDGPAIAPSHAGAKMPFSLSLSKLGTNVYKAMTEGNTGVPIYVTYTYTGLTAPAYFRIEVDWDQTYNHLSTATRAKVGGSYGPIGANVGAGLDTARDDLIENKCIRIETVGNEGYSKEDLDSYIEPILERINEELTNQTPPDMVEPTEAQDVDHPDTDKSSAEELGMGESTVPFGVNISASFNMKIKKQTKKGKQVYDFTGRQAMDRTSSAGAFIGIGGFSQAVKDKCVTVVERGGWESAFFVLPVVGDRVEEMGVKSLDLTIVVVRPDGSKGDKQTARFKDGEWIFNEESRTMLVFPLQDLYAKYGEKSMLKSAKYEIEAQFTLDDGSFVTKQTIPMFTGDAPVASPLNAVKAVNIGVDSLTFHSDDEEDSMLASMKVKLTSGKRSKQSKLIKLKDDAIYPEEYENGINWFVDAREPLNAEITFTYLDPYSEKDFKKRPKMKYNWKYNTVPLNRPYLLENKKEDAALKQLAEALKEEKTSKKFAGILKAYNIFISGLKLTEKSMKDYRAGNAMAPVGYVFSLEDPKVSDLAFDKSAAKDSKFAKTLKPWGDLVYTKLKGEEKFTDDAFLSGIEEPLWYRYETTENFRSFDDEDDDE